MCKINMSVSILTTNALIKTAAYDILFLNFILFSLFYFILFIYLFIYLFLYFSEKIRPEILCDSADISQKMQSYFLRK